MKKIILMLALMSAQMVFANDYKPVATIYQNSSGEQVILSAKDDINVCIEDCIANFDSPGPALKQCIARCKR